MHEVLLTQIFPPSHGGSGRWFFEIFSRKRSRSVVVTKSASSSISEEKINNMMVHRCDLFPSSSGVLSFSNVVGAFKLLRYLRSLHKTQNFEIATAGRVVPEGWILWLWHKFFGGPPYRIFSHGEEINLEGIKDGGVMSSRQHRIIAHLAFSSAELVIANSENTRRILANQWKLPPQKLRVLYPGVDTSFFQPKLNENSISPPSTWRDRFILLTVGRLQRRKGQDRVLQAIDYLRSSIPNIMYVIAGSGEDENRLRALTKELNIEEHVEFHTQLDDQALLSCYQNCDLFIMANRTVGADVEGFGMVFLEAAACGKPTIAGRSGGTHEAIADEATGLLVDGDHITSISETVLRLHSSLALRKELGFHGRKRAVSQFDWEVLARKFEDLV